MSNATIDAATLLSITRNRNKLLRLAEGIKPRKKYSTYKKNLDLKHDPGYTNIEHLVFGSYRPRTDTPERPSVTPAPPLPEPHVVDHAGSQQVDVMRPQRIVARIPTLEDGPPPSSRSRKSSPSSSPRNLHSGIPKPKVYAKKSTVATPPVIQNGNAVRHDKRPSPSSVRRRNELKTPVIRPPLQTPGKNATPQQAPGKLNNAKSVQSLNQRPREDKNNRSRSSDRMTCKITMLPPAQPGLPQVGRYSMRTPTSSTNFVPTRSRASFNAVRSRLPANPPPIRNGGSTRQPHVTPNGLAKPQPTAYLVAQGTQQRRPSLNSNTPKSDVFGLRDSKKYQAVMVPPGATHTPRNTTPNRSINYKNNRIRPEKPPIIHPKPIMDFAPLTSPSGENPPPQQHNAQVATSPAELVHPPFQQQVEDKISPPTEPVVTVLYKNAPQNHQPPPEPPQRDTDAIYDNVELFSSPSSNDSGSPQHLTNGFDLLPLEEPRPPRGIKSSNLPPPNYHIPAIEPNRQFLMVNGTSETLVAKPPKSSAPVLKPLLARKPPHPGTNSLPLHPNKDPAIMALARKRGCSTIPPRTNPFFSDIVEEGRGTHAAPNFEMVESLVASVKDDSAELRKSEEPVVNSAERWLRKNVGGLSRSARQLKAASTPEVGAGPGPPLPPPPLRPGRASYPAASLPSVARHVTTAKCDSLDSGIQISELLPPVGHLEEHRLSCHRDRHSGSPCKRSLRNAGPRVERQLSSPTARRLSQMRLRRASSQPAELDKVALKLDPLFHGVSDQDCSLDGGSSEGEDTESYHSLYTTPTRVPGNDGIHCAEALWDHMTMEGEELGFRAGEVVRVTDCHDKDWWWGSVGDRCGWFPASFVRLRVHQTPGPEKGPADRHAEQVRTNVVREILATERDFVRHLQDVIQGYLSQVRRRPDMFSGERIGTIFGNIEQIFSFQSKFLSHLESCIDEENPHNSLIGDCFLHHKEQFEIYSQYCNNHPLAVSELQELYAEPKYLHFFEACRLLQEMIDISLDGFLLTPVQKICKYPLQLAELLKYTPASHADHGPVTAALQAMRAVAHLVNERKRRAECLERLVEWQNSVEGWEGPSITDTSSMLIHSGEVVRRTAAAWSRDLHLFLFDHVLILCKKDLLKRHNFVFKGRISLDNGLAFAVEDCKEKTGWKVHCACRDKWFCFYSRSPHERDLWLEAFSRERHRVRMDAEQGFVVSSEAKKAAHLAVMNKLKPKRPKAKVTKSSRPDTAVAELLLDPLPAKSRSGSLPSSLHPGLAVAASLPAKKKQSSGWFHFGSSKKRAK